jgi:hypothetical protein
MRRLSTCVTVTAMEWVTTEEVVEVHLPNSFYCFDKQ